MSKTVRTITGAVRVHGRAKINGVPIIKVTVVEIDGVQVHPTKLSMTGKARKRGDKLYAPNGVYKIVA